MSIENKKFIAIAKELRCIAKFSKVDEHVGNKVILDGTKGYQFFYDSYVVSTILTMVAEMGVAYYNENKAGNLGTNICCIISPHKTN